MFEPLPKVPRSDESIDATCRECDWSYDLHGHGESRSESQVTSKQILTSLRRRWLVVVVAVVVVTGAAIAYATVKPATYQSSAVVQIATPTASGGGTSPLTLPEPLGQLAGTQVAQRAAVILKPFGLSGAGAVSGVVDPTTGALTVTASGPSPQVAQVVAQAYAQAFVDVTQNYVQSQVAKYTTALAALGTKISNLQAQQSQGATANPLVTAQITALTQSYGTLQAAQSSIQIGSPYATVQIGAEPGVPTGLSRSKLIGVGLLGGLIVGTGLALALDQLDGRIRDTEGLASFADGPLLAELPLDRSVRSGEVSLSLVQAPQSSLSESIRDLRTSLRVLLADHEHPLVAITSPEPGDGKTYVTANLATAWALTGMEVIVVSADFRRPRLEEIFGITPDGRPGLSDLIASSWHRPLTGEQSSLDTAVVDTLVETGIEGLRLLSVGTALSNPSELFGSPVMGSILDVLRHEADVVLVDTPPVLATPDTAILGGLTDGAVLVATGGKTDRADLERTARRLETTNCSVIGLVLNKVRRSPSDAYQAYSYRP